AVRNVEAFLLVKARILREERRAEGQGWRRQRENNVDRLVVGARCERRYSHRDGHSRDRDKILPRNHSALPAAVARQHAGGRGALQAWAQFVPRIERYVE